jgi:hypothetical protein
MKKLMLLLTLTAMVCSAQIATGQVTTTAHKPTYVQVASVGSQGFFTDSLNAKFPDIIEDLVIVQHPRTKRWHAVLPAADADATMNWLKSKEIEAFPNRELAALVPPKNWSFSPPAPLIPLDFGKQTPKSYLYNESNLTLGQKEVLERWRERKRVDPDQRGMNWPVEFYYFNVPTASGFSEHRFILEPQNTVYETSYWTPIKPFEGSVQGELLPYRVMVWKGTNFPKLAPQIDGLMVFHVQQSVNEDTSFGTYFLVKGFSSEAEAKLVADAWQKTGIPTAEYCVEITGQPGKVSGSR